LNGKNIFKIKKIVEQETSSWGIDVTSIKIQDIELPAAMKRAMAAQAETEKENPTRSIKKCNFCFTHRDF